MKSNKVLWGAAALSAALMAPAAMADDFSIGLGAAIGQYAYKGIDNDTVPYPMINYEGERFFIRGTGAGAYMFKDQHNQLSLNVFYSPLNFDPDDSDSHRMKQLDKRHSTAMAGVGYRHIADWGVVRTSLSADVLDYSNGYVADAAYLHPFNLGALTLTPGIGATWYSSNFNDYYYGISGKESRRSGLNAYNAGSSWSPYAEVSANYALTQSWKVFAYGRYTRLDSEVKDSPMVDKSYTTLVAAGVSYAF